MSSPYQDDRTMPSKQVLQHSAILDVGDIAPLLLAGTIRGSELFYVGCWMLDIFAPLKLALPRLQCRT
jgi:hypothetical protein